MYRYITRTFNSLDENGKKVNVKKKMLTKHFHDHARIYLSFTYVEDLKRKERIIKK